MIDIKQYKFNCARYLHKSTLTDSTEVIYLPLKGSEGHRLVVAFAIFITNNPSLPIIVFRKHCLVVYHVNNEEQAHAILKSYETINFSRLDYKNIYLDSTKKYSQEEKMKILKEELNNEIKFNLKPTIPRLI